MDIMDSETTSTILTSSRHRVPNLLQNQEGVLHEEVNSLRQSRSGYVGKMTKVCSQIDGLLVDFANLMHVQNLQAGLNDAFEIIQTTSVALEVFLLVTAQSCRKSMVYATLKRSGNVSTIQRLNSIP